jgi:hypothetical protein
MNETRWWVMATGDVSLLAGWIGILCGVIAGSYAGLFFHQEAWVGGYGAFSRRMLRLGHISFFGLGILNILFGVTAKVAGYAIPHPSVAAGGFLLGAATMPLCCYLTAWKTQFRFLFPLPVVAVAVGIVLVLLGWFSS